PSGARVRPEPTWEPAAVPVAAESVARSRRRRRLVVALAGVGAVLLAGVGVAAFLWLQVLRITDVSLDQTAAIEASGTTMTISVSRALDPVDASQVRIEPAVPFTLDGSDASKIGIRFTDALDDSTKYTVTIDGATVAGGGASTDLQTSFRTPKSRVLLLLRDKGDDKIFATDLAGEKAVPVFAHARITGFRASPEVIVVAVEEKDGSHLIAMDRDGSHQRELPLPGAGYVQGLQLSDSGGLVGYTFSDRDLTETSGRASVLVTQSVKGGSAPRVVQVDGKDASTSDWRFAPGSAQVLFIDFNAALLMQRADADAQATSFGLAARILGVAHDARTAIVQRTDGSITVLDLADGTEKPLPATTPDYGAPTTVVPFPGGSLQHVVQRTAQGMPTGQAVIRVDGEGAAKPLIEVSGADSIMQVCVAPSGQYAAVVVAPDLTANPYDDLLVPLPTTLHTHLFDLRSGATLPVLAGFDISWCQTPPRP
ncbi:MAG: Ig-like domain-containing protein, partial [Microbacterium sp.]